VAVICKDKVRGGQEAAPSFGGYHHIKQKETSIMGNKINKKLESLKKNIKTPLGVIGLLMITLCQIIYGIQVSNNNHMCEVSPLVYILVTMLFIVFVSFLYMVIYHPEKIYGFRYFAETDFVKKNTESTINISGAKIKQNKPIGTGEDIQKQTKDGYELFRNMCSKKETDYSKVKILWVDDSHDNNIYERKAFESQGITIDIRATNTEEALKLLNDNEYEAIISDMHRREGEEEGYVLLEAIRDRNIKTPFFIYTGYSTAADRETIRQKDGQGITAMPDELYEMVMDVIN